MANWIKITQWRFTLLGSENFHAVPFPQPPPLPPSLFPVSFSPNHLVISVYSNLPSLTFPPVLSQLPSIPGVPSAPQPPSLST